MPWSRSERIGVIALLVIVAGAVGFGALQAGRSVTSTGLSLRESFPQTPVTPPDDSRQHASIGDRQGTSNRKGTSDRKGTSSEVGSPHSSAAPDEMVVEVVVHVAGAVKRPGVYHLSPGARNDDALKAAGGPTRDANTDAVNLAARVEDGSQLYFPTHRERPEGGASPAPEADTASSSSALAMLPARKAHTSHSGGNSRRGRNTPGKLTSPNQGQIELNSASSAELQRIPGVGPSMAARIIAFRQQNGGFHQVEDLLQVSGIGAKKFAKMQPFVKIGGRE